jgi:hypothetical protein
VVTGATSVVDVSGMAQAFAVSGAFLDVSTDSVAGKFVVAVAVSSVLAANE